MVAPNGRVMRLRKQMRAIALATVVSLVGLAVPVCAYAPREAPPECCEREQPRPQCPRSASECPLSEKRAPVPAPQPAAAAVPMAVELEPQPAVALLE
ncbi:MAG: hypothetical protein ACRD96_14270, partial [Bryobacteraceae bacterium]